jgi:hypothetical protein
MNILRHVAKRLSQHHVRVLSQAVAEPREPQRARQRELIRHALPASSLPLPRR